MSLNKITVIPDKIGNLRRLRELSIDYNNLFKLPLTFYKLSKLKILRLEGNESLGDPPADVLSQGAAACVAYLKKRYTDDVTWRQRVIITSVQNCLQQGWERGITDSSMFEPDTVINDGPDHWYAFQLSYFWEELVPELRKIWGVEGRKNKQQKNSIWINNFPLQKKRSSGLSVTSVMPTV